MGTLYLHATYLHVKHLAPPEPQKHPHQIQPGPHSASGVFLFRCFRCWYTVTYFSCSMQCKIYHVGRNYTLCWTFLQIQSVAPPSAFGVKFYKCAQVWIKPVLISTGPIWNCIWTFWRPSSGSYSFCCSIMCSPGKDGLWPSTADILPGDSQHGPSGWHQPVSGGYPGLHLWNSALKIWRQGGGKGLPDVCHWFTVWYVWFEL